jgi:hypothetical protein
MKNYSGILLILLVLLAMPVQSQSDNYDWWIETHDWDGITHWKKYLILSPAFLGPNALPVPETMTGIIKKQHSFALAYENHFAPGDKTHNLHVNAFFPLFSDKAGLYFSMVPLEVFSMDPEVRDKRRARNFEGTGSGVGDLYIATHVQLLEDHQKYPDILLTINLRTASGSNLNSARFTDTPGYFFDVSFGETYHLKNKYVNQIRPFLSAGFYVWQTNLDVFYQNDAFLYAAGVKMKLFDAVSLSNIFTGYSGYIDNGDKPRVYRLILESERDKRVDFMLMYQIGIHDYPFNTVRVGLSAKLF